MKIIIKSPSSHAERRIKKYWGDDTYRERIKMRERASYRKRRNVELSSCLYSLDFLPKLASMRAVETPSGTQASYPVFSIPKTADALQKLYQTVWRWVRNGQIPSPVLYIKGTQTPVYHLDEVRILVEEIGRHEKNVRYFRSDHQDVIDRIQDRVTSVREGLNILSME